MDLKQRKKIINIPKFNYGDDGNSSYNLINNYNGSLQKKYQFSFKSPYDYSLTQSGPLTQNSFSINKPISIQDGKIGNVGTDNFKEIKGAGIGNEKLSAGIGKGLGAASAGLSIAQGMMSSLNVKSQDQIQQEAGSTNQTIMGVNYDQQNAVDGSQDLKEQNSKGLTNTASSTLSGASAGLSVGGPWGAVIGGAVGLVSGLFGWLGGRSKLRKRIRNAKIQASQTAQLQRSQAMSKGLQNQYYLDYGDTSTQTLYV